MSTLKSRLEKLEAAIKPPAKKLTWFLVDLEGSVETTDPQEAAEWERTHPGFITVEVKNDNDNR